MTDDPENDLLETGDIDSDAGLEDFETGEGRKSFKDAWKTNPLVKIGAVAAGLAIIVGAFTLFKKDDPVAPSMMTSTQQQLKQAPGGKVSDVYAKAVKEVNEQNVQTAIREGTSALPVPVGPSRGKVELEATKESAEDPLERWRRIQEERLKKEQQAKVNPANVATTTATATAPQEPVDPNATAKQAMAASMQTQMQSVLQAQMINPLKSKQVTSDDFLKKQAEEKNKEVQAKQEAANAASSSSEVVEVLLEAGRIEYAQLITEADSDVPGPILAQLASGPMLGARMLGSFQVQDEYLTLNFDSIVVNGIAVAVNAIAIDPATAKVGLVTDVDHKYFQRIVLPAAAAFIQGLGSAIATSGTTTVSAGQGTTTTAEQPLDTKKELFKGVEKGAEKVSNIVDQEAQAAKVRVRVAAGTHIGVLFMKEVTKDPQTPAPVAAAATPSAPQQLLLQLQPAAVAAQGQIQQAVQSQPQLGTTANPRR